MFLKDIENTQKARETKTKNDKANMVKCCNSEIIQVLYYSCNFSVILKLLQNKK